MNIAITVWQNRISPVFDSAQALLIVQTREAVIVDAVIKDCQASMLHKFIQLLQKQKVNVLICGALCERPATLLENHGIEVISFMTGEADKVLEGYLRGNDMSDFSMPGCGRSRCCRTKNQSNNERTGKITES